VTVNPLYVYFFRWGKAIGLFFFQPTQTSVIATRPSSLNFVRKRRHHTGGKPTILFTLPVVFFPAALHISRSWVKTQSPPLMFFLSMVSDSGSFLTLLANRRSCPHTLFNVSPPFSSSLVVPHSRCSDYITSSLAPLRSLVFVFFTPFGKAPCAQPVSSPLLFFYVFRVP